MKAASLTKMPARLLKGTVWAKVDYHKAEMKLDYDDLQLIFADIKPVKKKKEGEVKKKKEGPIEIIDPKMANNCSIFLSRFKVDYDGIIAAIYSMDEEILNEEQVEGLCKYFPTAEEVPELQNWEARDPSGSGDEKKLGQAEQYMVKLIRMQRYDQRLLLWNIKLKFQEQTEFLINQLEAVIMSCRVIKHSKKFRTLLEYILALGNVLNAGSFRGNASAVCIDVMKNVKDCKSNGLHGKKDYTLMHFMMDTIKEKDPEVLEVIEDMLPLEAAKKVSCKLLQLRRVWNTRAANFYTQVDFNYLETECRKVAKDVSAIEKELAVWEKLKKGGGINETGTWKYQDNFLSVMEKVSAHAPAACF